MLLSIAEDALCMASHRSFGPIPGAGAMAEALGVSQGKQGRVMTAMGGAIADDLFLVRPDESKHELAQRIRRLSSHTPNARPGPTQAAGARRASPKIAPALPQVAEVEEGKATAWVEGNGKREGEGKGEGKG